MKIEFCRYVFPLLILFFISNLQGQQTVGVYVNEEAADDGYIFFSPMYATDSYLVDRCGRLVNKWERNSLAGLSAHLLPNGLLFRTEKTFHPQYSQTSSGGHLELVDWDNNVVWQYDFSGDEWIQHHDAHYMPNGHILVLLWERAERNEYLEWGKEDPGTDVDLWTERILEIEPVGTDTFTVHWDWRLRDHFIQDHDSTKLNFGNVADNPYLVDVNYGGPSRWDFRDWWHANALWYNEETDEIVLNARSNHEVWILDHSTTIAEAASHSGGNHGRGGDVLYRWGNPEAYQKGGDEDLRMFGSHGNNWIPRDQWNGGGIMYFNNGDRRPGGLRYSTIEILHPERNKLNHFVLGDNGRFGPEESIIAYGADSLTSFYSRYLSNAHVTPNGNVFINEGGSGHLFEVDQNGLLVWDYVSPVGSQTGVVSQGGDPRSESIFRAYKYPANYAGFEGKDMTPEEFPLEGDNEFFSCLISKNDNINALNFDLRFLSNIQQLQIENPDLLDYNLKIFTLEGRLALSKNLKGISQQIELNSLQTGIYAVQIQTSIGQMTKKIYVH